MMSTNRGRVNDSRDQEFAFGRHLSAAESTGGQKRDHCSRQGAIAPQKPKPSRRWRAIASGNAKDLDIAANIFYDAIAEQHFNLHLLNEVVPFFNPKEAFDLPLIDFLL